MTPFILSALLALAPGDSDAARKDRSAQAEPKQILTTVSLGDGASAAKKSAMKARGMVQHPAPTMPPLVARVQPDGSLRYGHGYLETDTAAGRAVEEKSE